MTYTRPLRRYQRKAKPALSGWLDDIIQGVTGVPQISSSGACLAIANATVAPFDAKIDDLAKNWTPTGFYEPNDIRTLVSSTMALVVQAQSAVDTAAQEPQAAQDSVMRATSDLARAGSRSLDYLQAATDAEHQGVRVVNAPGFKRWVTDTMSAASSALVTASVIGCERPWWTAALAGFQIAFDALFGVASRVVGVVLAVGETALKIAGDLPELYDVLKWAALAAGGYWVWKNYLR